MNVRQQAAPQAEENSKRKPSQPVLCVGKALLRQDYLDSRGNHHRRSVFDHRVLAYHLIVILALIGYAIGVYKDNPMRFMRWLNILKRFS